MRLIFAQRVLLLTVILIASTALAAAQSGRRSKTKPTAPTAPPPATEPPAPAKAQAPVPRLELLVGVDETTGFERVPLSAPDVALDACMRRLREAGEVKSEVAPRRMTRSDAIKAAKAEDTRYVVWLQVRNERDDSSGAVSTQDDWLYIDFTIFEPVTGKIKKTGRAHAGGGQVGNVGVSGRVPRSVYSDYEIRESGRQAADRILDAFQIKLEGWPR